jgi:hypothetical protein
MSQVVEHLSSEKAGGPEFDPQYPFPKKETKQKENTDLNFQAIFLQIISLFLYVFISRLSLL